VIVCIAGVITFLSNPFAGVIVLLVGAIMVLPVMLYLSATSAVFSLAVWEYIDDGAPRGPFAAADLERPFVGGAGVAKTRQWLKTHVPRRRA
jgi:hypothetical protein